jgi:hypothetical protein
MIRIADPAIQVLAILVIAVVGLSHAWLRYRLEAVRQSARTARLLAVLKGTDPDRRSDVLRAYNEQEDGSNCTATPEPVVPVQDRTPDPGP